jgi:hypothetical protein
MRTRVSSILRLTTVIALAAVLTGGALAHKTRAENRASGSPWTPDNGNGTYRHPVIHADFEWFRIE